MCSNLHRLNVDGKISKTAPELTSSPSSFILNEFFGRRMGGWGEGEEEEEGRRGGGILGSSSLYHPR